MNESQEYLEKGIKLGAALGGIIAARGVFKGTRIAGKGVYRRAVKLRGSNGR